MQPTNVELTSLIYAENPAIREDKQYKQSEGLATAIGSNYFLSLDDKPKQKYKVKTNNIQGYDLYQIKKEELSGHISKFRPLTYPVIVNYFLFSLSLLTTEELKGCRSLEP